METEELSERVQSGSLTEEAQALAVEELARRGVTTAAVLPPVQHANSAETLEGKAGAALRNIKNTVLGLLVLAAVQIAVSLVFGQLLFALVGVALAAVAIRLLITKSVALATALTVSVGLLVIFNLITHIAFSVHIGNLMLSLFLLGACIALVRSTKTWQLYVRTRGTRQNA